MTLDEFREMTKDMPGDRNIMYHAYDKGCCLSTFQASSVWSDNIRNVIVMNPGEDYDGRKPKKQGEDNARHLKV